MKINGISIYIVSLVFLITSISMNSLQYQKNPFWYQHKQGEKEVYDVPINGQIVTTTSTPIPNTGRDSIVVSETDQYNIYYKPTMLDSFYSIIGIDGFYKNGVWLQIIYIVITFILYNVVEGVFGSLIAIIIFVIVMLSNYWYTWNSQPEMCNNVKLYDSSTMNVSTITTQDYVDPVTVDKINTPTTDNYNKYMFSNMANLSTVLLSMVLLIFYTMSKYKSSKTMILIIFMLVYVGICIYDYSLLTRSQLNQLSLGNKVCNSTMLHGFYYIEGALLFFIFSMFKIPEINLKNFKIKI